MSYRDAIVWQKAMQAAELTCAAVERMAPGRRGTIGSQMTRAAVSVASNVAEGWSRDSSREKARFLTIAQGSLDELQTQVTLCTRLAWVEPATSKPLLALNDEVGKMLTSLRRRFRSPPKTSR